MNRKKPKKSKSPPLRKFFGEPVVGAEEAIMHLRLIEHGGDIVKLYQQFFPTEFARHGIDYTSAASVLDSYDYFAHLVDRNLFPIWPFSDLGGIYDHPEHCLTTMHLCMFGSYHWYERLEAVEELPLVEKLIINAWGEDYVFEELDFRLPKERVFELRRLVEACAKQKGALRHLDSAAAAVLGATGNFWLDMTEEEFYQIEHPEWNELNINYLAAEYREAKEFIKEIEAFFTWVRHNPTRIEKVKRLLRQAWRPKKEQRIRVQTHSGKPLVETLGGVF